MHDGFDITSSGDREIAMTRLFTAPRGLVFATHTEPELLKHWLSGPPGWTMPVCEVDLRVGGSYRFEWAGADGMRMGMGGVYREIAAPERIVQTQRFDQDWTGGEVVGTLELMEHEGKTRLLNTLLYASPEVRDALLKSGMARGVAASYDRLAELLASLRQ
jgi:uncharacterized protein YndB with AHSA1/START domain